MWFSRMHVQGHAGSELSEDLPPKESEFLRQPVPPNAVSPDPVPR